jgi:hypothetical protein
VTPIRPRRKTEGGSAFFFGEPPTTGFTTVASEFYHSGMMCIPTRLHKWGFLWYGANAKRAQDCKPHKAGMFS